MNEVIKILRTIALITLGIVALSVLGVAVNAVVPWQKLTDLFVIIRTLADMGSWFWDTSTLFLLTGIGLSLQASVWVYKATMAIIHYFRVKS